MSADAFGVLYNRLALRAHHVAFSVLSPDADRARDAVQDGFLAIWRGRMNYRPDLGEVDAWAFAAVRNRAIDELRRERRRDGANRLAGVRPRTPSHPVPGCGSRNS